MPINAWKPVGERAIRSKPSMRLVRVGRAAGSRRWFTGRAQRSSTGRKLVRCHPDVQDAGSPQRSTIVGQQVDAPGARRLSFSRFLRGSRSRTAFRTPRAVAFREKLAKARIDRRSCTHPDRLAAKGYMARGGHVIDARCRAGADAADSRDESTPSCGSAHTRGVEREARPSTAEDRGARWSQEHDRQLLAGETV